MRFGAGPGSAPTTPAAAEQEMLEREAAALREQLARIEDRLKGKS
jgi:hypothetical protein